MNINASLFVQMAVFFFGAWVTMKYIWPPLIRAIEERQKKIDGGLAAADKGEMALAEAQKEVQAIKAEARAQALGIVNDSEKRGQAIVEEAKAQAQAEVAQEAQRVREQLRAEVARLAVAGAEQILRREVDTKVHAEMLEQLKAKL